MNIRHYNIGRFYENKKFLLRAINPKSILNKIEFADNIL